MPYIPRDMLKKTLKNSKKMQLEFYANHNIYVNGHEKTKEEIIINNLIEFMNEKKIPLDQQIIFLNKYSLYLCDKYTKNRGSNAIFKGVIEAGMAMTTCFLIKSNDHLALTSALITLLCTGSYILIKNVRSNLYEKDLKALEEYNYFFNDVREEEKIIRKAIKHNSYAKTLLK
jgi:hypothetical protein